jgi:hypothetical protein
MLYKSAADWRNAPEKRIMLFGMSGLGKTHISNLLREGKGWFHYSVDYRIGTRYMGEHIADNFKREAMKVPLLAELLKSDSVYIQSNITFDNLAPLSTYLGKPGDPAKGGLLFAEYLHRQDLHRAAEAAALLENDPVLSALADNVLMVWIEGSDAHTQELVQRFDRAPKPMCYNADFLTKAWADYSAETSQPEDKVDPDAFVRWTYARALAHRQPRYRAMADNWGITVQADDIARVETEADMIDLIAKALP